MKNIDKNDKILLLNYILGGKKMTLGELIKEKRTILKMSQRDLAKKCQLTQSAIYRIETSLTKVPNKKTIKILASVLNLNKELLQQMGYDVELEEIEETEKDYLIFQNKKIPLDHLEEVELKIISLIVDKYTKF